jgi:6-phosphogluconolactonase (cycloisomerase 2 family)
MHYLPRRFPRAILVGLASLLGAAAIPAVAAASPSHQNGYVYVNDNTAGQNTIAAFARQADGTLTARPGSPYAAGGAGSGSGLTSQGAIQVTSDGRYVLAVDAGSDQVSVLRIRHHGALKLVSVASSHGVTPVSVTERDGLVYVANAGAGGSNYTGFTLTGGGRLEPLTGSTVSLPDDGQPGDVLFNSTGTNLVGTRVGTSQIDSFHVRSTGRLTPATGSTPVSNQSGVGAVDARLSADGQTLYVDESRVAAVGEFAVHGSALTEIGSVALPAGATPAGVAVK